MKSVHFEQETDDHPSEKPAWGVAGWTKGDKSVLVNDHFDIWEFDPNGREAGRERHRFGRRAEQHPVPDRNLGAGGGRGGRGGGGGRGGFGGAAAKIARSIRPSRSCSAR
jgi:hypothetical protein